MKDQSTSNFDWKLAFKRLLKLPSIGGFVFLFLGGIVSCITTSPPIEEFALAQAALDAARKWEAARYSPGYFHQAEEAYRRGKIFYFDRDYSSAEDEFIKARKSSEKAENSTRLLRLKSGETL